MHFKLKPYIYTAAACLMILIFCHSPSAFSDSLFEIKRIGNIHSYENNAFVIRSESAGELTISIHDDVCVYRTLTEKITSGETRIEWDGCAYNKEKLYEKTYTITGVLTDDSGRVHTTSFQSPVEYPGQYLQYALPSSDNLYLDTPEQWFIEFKTVKTGTVIITLSEYDSPGEPLYRYKISATGGKITRKDFNSFSRERKPETGKYIMNVFEASRPENIYEYSLNVLPERPDAPSVSTTGEIMPERGMTEEQIWELMMKPSVVVNIDFFKHQNVYEKQDTGSKSLGTLHGQTQGLKVISIDGAWAFIGAWNHEAGEYIEGWVPCDKLKTEKPSAEYGLLVDKQLQTLTVYYQGKILDTVFVSTGRAEKNSLYQETSAGCYLTGYHRVNFSMNGKKYDYVIQYDGGNLIHQTPYDWGKNKKDFTLGRGYLGAKASHACIRVQPEPGTGGINAYWLFTHLPYHTRVIILDDPAERAAEYNRLMKTDDNVQITGIPPYPDYENTETDQIVTLTFGGNIIPGGSKSFNSRRESFVSFVSQQGYDQPLSLLAQVFSEDDLTCVALGGLLEGDQASIPENGDIQYGPLGSNEIFRDASVEMIIISDDIIHTKQDSISDTIKQAQRFADTMDKTHPATIELKGHLFGVAGCTESEYLADSEIIFQRISVLKEMKCEKIVFYINGKDRGAGNRTIVQEAMANKCVIAGADLVIFSFDGQAGGIDFIRGVPVVYNTGTILDGSTSRKPKSFYSMLVQARFDFRTENGNIIIATIPICPYGHSETEKNSYIPQWQMTPTDITKFQNLVGHDSSDDALQRITIRTSH